jgi:Family of unknown function (DUF6502)
MRPAFRPHPMDTPDTGTDAAQQALSDALAGLLASVGRLAVGRGLPYAAAEELLKQAFVQAASEAHPGLPEHRKVSRISTTTGINRREVTRLVQQRAEQDTRAPAPPPRSSASQVFAHWRADPAWRDSQGQPRVLPRLGPAPSFEALAQEVTRDVHPRSLLDELVRLGLASWDEAADTVALARETFTVRGDVARQLGYLGGNVGDHLSAAVANVLGGDDRRHFEQAVFAGGLSAESIDTVRPVVQAHWQSLLQALVPLLEARVAADEQLDPPPQGRVRVGLFSFHEGGAPSAPPTVARPARANRKV